MTTEIITTYEFIRQRKDIVGDRCATFLLPVDATDSTIRIFRSNHNEPIWDELVKRAKAFKAKIR